MHGGQGLPAAPLQTAVHALRLVHDQDRPGGPDEIDRLLAAGAFAVLVEVVDVLLVDGPHRHHHDPDLRAGGEIPDPARLGGVVEEVFERRPRVERPEVFLRDPERFVDTFLDGDRRHDDDEFGEAVALVQLEDRAQVHVGLAGPRLHLHAEVTGSQGLGKRDAVAELDGAQVVEDFLVGQGKPVADAEAVFGKSQPPLELRGASRDGEFGTADLLTAEQVTDRVDRPELEVEVGLEVELHRMCPLCRPVTWNAPCRWLAVFAMDPSGKHQALALGLRDGIAEFQGGVDP